MKQLFVFISVLFFSASTLFSQSSSYKISGKIDIGGEGWWDYVAIDVPMHRLYVAHSTKVHVIDLSSNSK